MLRPINKLEDSACTVILAGTKPSRPGLWRQDYGKVDRRRRLVRLTNHPYGRVHRRSEIMLTQFVDTDTKVVVR